MKTYFFLAALLFLAMSSAAQEPTVKIKINDEERFRFDSIRLIFVNPSHHVMIGDSVGMNDTANANTEENTFLGFKAGAVNRGSWNTFLGTKAGENHTTGYDNVFVGGWAGKYDSLGEFNTYVGANAGLYCKSGDRNTFIGRNTGIGRDTGVPYDLSSSNTFIGYNAGYYHSGGLYNVIIGRNAGAFSGRFGPVDNNTYLGGFAGQNNIYGQGNVFIGYQAGMNDTTSSKLYISNTDTVPPLVYGEFDTKMLRFNAGRLEIRNYQENTFLGDSAGVVNTGRRNVFVGFRAGYKTENSDDNIFLGDSAGYSTTTGGANLFIGSWAGCFNTTGRANVFLGYGSGISNDTGRLNVMVGATSGLNNTTGGENVFLGTSAGANNNTGSCNTFLGRKAGLNNLSGDSSVFVGYFAGAQEMASHRLYIANSATNTPLIYGEFDNELLRVYGTLDIKGIYQFPITDGTSGQVLKTDGSGTVTWASAGGDFSNGGEAGGADRTLGNMDNYALGFITNNTTRLHISNDGKIGMGTSSPSTNLEVAKDQGIATITATSYRIADFGAGQFIGRAARGSMNTPSAVQAGDYLASFNGRGYGDTGFSIYPRGRLGIVAAENFTDASQGAHIVIETTPAGTILNAIERMRITSEGYVGIGTTAPTATMDINGNTGYDQLRMRTSYTPTDSNDTNGNTGDVAWDDGYFYVKTGTGWKRAALLSF